MKTALVFGSSGLIGSHLLKFLIQSINYNKIKLFVRSPSISTNNKIEIIQIDFNNLNEYSNEIIGDDCYYCIGTTKKNSPNKDDYRKVELDIPKKIAHIARSNFIKSFIFVSSGFANPKHSGEYLRYKGLVEEQLKELNFLKLGIMRPSFLMGERKDHRIGEKIGILIFKIFTPFFIGPLRKMRPIYASNVAKVMVNIPIMKLNKNIFESDEIEVLSKN